MICYPKKVGRYSYFENEGSFEVTKDGTVISRPNGNASAYEHPIQEHAANTNFVYTRDRGDYVHFVALKCDEIGPDCYYTSYHFFSHHSSFSQQEQHIPVTYAKEYTLKSMVPQSTTALVSIENGVGLFEQVTDDVKEIVEIYTPPAELLTKIAPHVRTKDLREKISLFSAYFLANSAFPGKYDHNTV